MAERYIHGTNKGYREPAADQPGRHASLQPAPPLRAAAQYRQGESSVCDVIWCTLVAIILKAIAKLGKIVPKINRT